MRTILLLAACATAGVAHAADDWPTSFKTDGGDTFGITTNLQYDVNRFDGDDAGFTDADRMRREDFGVTVKGAAYDFTAQYDFANKQWLDTALRVQAKALFGREIGAVRVGYFKTPVGLDAVAASRALTFLETPLATQAISEGRRTGIEWAATRPRWNASVAYFGGRTLDNTDGGNTLGARAVWTPHKADGDVWHLGIAASREEPDSGTARLRARPEASLTDTRLIDTGTLASVLHIDRAGLEFIRVAGPWTVLAEALQADVARGDGLRDVDAQGGTVYASWIATGESHPYNGTLGNVVPSRASGALELLLRYSTLDLNDAGIAGGREDNWTAGANYYLTEHFKFQLNYVRAHSRRNGVVTEPDILEARAQLYF